MAMTPRKETLQFCSIDKIIIMKLSNIKKGSPSRDCNSATYMHAMYGESLKVS